MENNFKIIGEVKAVCNTGRIRTKVDRKNIRKMRNLSSFGLILKNFPCMLQTKAKN